MNVTNFLSSLWVTPSFCLVYELLLPIYECCQLLSSQWVSPSLSSQWVSSSFCQACCQLSSVLCLEMLAGFYSVFVFPVSWQKLVVFCIPDSSEQVKLIAIIGRFCESSVTLDCSVGGVLCLCVSVLSVWCELKCYGEDRCSATWLCSGVVRYTSLPVCRSHFRYCATFPL